MPAQAETSGIVPQYYGAGASDHNQSEHELSGIEHIEQDCKLLISPNVECRIGQIDDFENVREKVNGQVRTPESVHCFNFPVQLMNACFVKRCEAMPRVLEFYVRASGSKLRR